MKKVVLSFDRNKLAGNLFIAKRKKFGLLFLHGGGAATKERYIELQEFLADKGYSSFSFDFRGVGESTGVFADGSLQHRLQDAQAAFDEFESRVDSIIVVGCSMGGHVAARLTETREVYALILLYAAAYAEEAENKPLNEEFTKILRRENSWKNSLAFIAVENYQGKILSMYGENDTVVPKELQNEFKRKIRKGTFLILPKASHLFLVHKNEEQEKSKEQAFKQILLFLK